MSDNTIEFEGQPHYGRLLSYEVFGPDRKMLELPDTVDISATYRVTLTRIEPEPVKLEILPCPHCGGRATVSPKGKLLFRVVCHVCAAKSCSRLDAVAAIGAWNRRA